jgi:hypothetical protein
VFSQNKFPDKFLDIKWGSSKATVLDKMQKTKGTSILKNEDEVLIMLGGKFANQKVDRWGFHFYKNQLAFVIVMFDVTKNNCEDNMNQIYHSLQAKYGEGGISKMNSNGLTFYWVFENENNVRIGTILLDYNIDGYDSYLHLTYGNEILAKKSEELKKKKDKESQNNEL